METSPEKTSCHSNPTKWVHLWVAGLHVPPPACSASARVSGPLPSSTRMSRLGALSGAIEYVYPGCSLGMSFGRPTVRQPADCQLDSASTLVPAGHATTDTSTVTTS